MCSDVYSFVVWIFFNVIFWQIPFELFEISSFVGFHDELQINSYVEIVCVAI